MTAPSPDTIERLYYSVKEWCRLHSIGRSKFYELVRAERVKIVKCGRKTLVPAGQSLPTFLPMSNQRIGAHNGARERTTKSQEPPANGHLSHSGARERT